VTDVGAGSGVRGYGTASAHGPASGVVVREATTEDAAAMVRLRAVMFEAMGTDADRLAEPGWRHAAHAWFADGVGAPGVRVVVAEVDGVVGAGAVGEVTSLIPGPATANGSVGLISNVATFPEHRGRGLARAVTDDLLAWFAEHTDVTRVDLFATREGARIYAQRGFTLRGFPAMCLAVHRERA
jgi:GNAT superfamily N-acetyltransferase